MATFSERFSLRPPDPKITVMRAAPKWLRDDIIRMASEFGITLYRIRPWLCDRLLILSPVYVDEYQMYAEVDRLFAQGQWYEVYELIEWIYQQLSDSNELGPHRFSEKINRYFRAKGIGWQLVSGKLEIRGSQVFEETMHTAIDLSKASGRSTTESELREALQDLSHRPEPKVSGAIQHAMAALECLAKDISQEPSLTLGEWIKKHREEFPKPDGRGSGTGNRTRGSIFKLSDPKESS
jgi:hypothetical protein